MTFIRRKNVFTGEWEEVEEDVEAAFEEVNAASRATVEHLVGGSRVRDPYNTGSDFVSRGMSIPPEQATPERIEKENAQARAHNTGAYYTPDGTCRLPTKGIRRREMRRRNRQDNDGGYGDYCGR